jgi:hypothetical protein
MTLGGVSPNPYQPPGASDRREPGQPNRTPFVLAAVGAGLASLYWAAMVVLVLSMGDAAGPQAFIPIVLVGLYGYRGYQIFTGDKQAAQRILWLHGIGAVMAFIQMMSGASGLAVFQGVKVAINVFGAITAYLATRA